MSNPFVLTPDDYTRDIDPVRHAIEQYSSYLQIQTNQPESVCREFVTKSFGQGGVFQFKDKKMKVARRDDTGDRALEETSVLKYLAEVKSRKLILAPTWTAYKSTEEQESFLAKNIAGNISLRNVAKKKMYAALL